jgi:MerR family regulatory protein
MASGDLRIGEVATRSGVSIDTVRYYERLQLLPPAPRTEGGFRLFTRETVARVQFIKQAQDLGWRKRVSAGEGSPASKAQRSWRAAQIAGRV